MHVRFLKILGISLSILLVVLGSFLLASAVADSDSAQTLVGQFGYLGMLIVSIIAGLNLVVPVPAATFAPLYISAGFPLVAITITMTLGTVIADAIGFLIGVGGKHITRQTHPRLQAKIQSFAHRHHHLVLPFVFLFAAVSPLPNELVVIPLALSGIRYRALFVPLLLGTIIYQTLLISGITGTFNYLF